MNRLHLSNAENAGWISFDTAVAGPLRARLEACCLNGQFHGYAWCENLGWINLDSVFGFVGLSPAAVRGKADVNGNGARNGGDV